MASLTNDGGGRFRVQFLGIDGKRHAIRLGVKPQRVAEEFRDNVAHLVACIGSPHLVADQVLLWAKGLPVKDYDKLAALELLPPREDVTADVMTLGTFLEEYFAALQVKPGTRTAYSHTQRCLLAHFGSARDIRSLSARDADGFHTFLAKHDFAAKGAGKTRILSAATVSRRILCARHMLNKAKRWGYIGENVFAGVKAGQQRNAARKFFVPLETIRDVMDACPDAQWRLIVALSRYGGMRCPSEHLGLKWTDVAWDKNTLTVHSPKTEHVDGGESRIIPLFPELRRELEAVWDQVPEAGPEWIITRYRQAKQNLRTEFLRIIRRAGKKPWPRLFQNLRASRETELMREYPIETVCAWIGNTPEVAVVHYLNDPDKDDHFRRAVGPVNPSQGKAAQNAAQTGAETDGKGREAVPAEAAKTHETHEETGVFVGSGMGAAGREQALKPREIKGFSQGGAQGGARGDDLRWLVGAWATLPEKIKADILTTARAAVPEKGRAEAVAATNKQLAQSILTQAQTLAGVAAPQTAAPEQPPVIAPA